MISTDFHPPEHRPSYLHAAHGYCRSCRIVHALPLEPALDRCRELMESLESSRSIQRPDQAAGDLCLSTDYLFGEARGKMFGVLVGHDRSGREQTLYAFSGQYNGIWHVPGWTPPLFDLNLFHRVHDDREREIKQLTRQLAALPRGTAEWQELTRNRKQLSRSLMKDIFDIYVVRNFRGQSSSLGTAFSGAGLPTGAGDCCAPKLLVSAARSGITPTGLAEFYWGRENRSGTRRHGRFYHSCREKCQPLLGFLLCGIP